MIAGTFNDFISTYGVTIMWTIVTTLAGLVANAARKYYKKYIDTKTKKEVVKTVVMAMEQLYKNLNGAEKLQMALEYASEMLQENGIAITDLELRMLIEAAVGEFNNVFFEPQEVEDEVEDETIEENTNDYDESVVDEKTEYMVDPMSGCEYPET